MEMIEVKTSELVGAALDWAVGKSIGEASRIESRFVNELEGYAKIIYWCSTSYSTDWAQGGPLIEKYKPWMSPPVNDPDPSQLHGWDAEIYDEDGYLIVGRAIGCPSSLVAVCRAIVSAKLGDTVQIPARLVNTK